MLAFRTAGRWYPRTIKSQGEVTRLSHSLTYLEYAYDRVVRRGRVFGGIRGFHSPCSNLVMRLLVLTKTLRQEGWYCWEGTKRSVTRISFDAGVHGIPSFYQTDVGPEDGLEGPALFVKPRLLFGFRGLRSRCDVM
jgi:hypothetical protein